jgi:RAP1 GTPase activating protein 1
VVSGAVTTITLDGSDGCNALAAAGHMERMHEEIANLRMDKLELLRQNVSSQHELRRLREREAHMQAELSAAAREIRRLREAGMEKTPKLKLDVVPMAVDGSSAKRRN